MAIQKSTPRLILILLTAVFFSGMSWAAMVPLWQTPDEQAHFAQAQDLAAVGFRPNPGASTSQDIVISEKLLGTFRDELGNNKFTYHPEYRLPYANSTIGFNEKEIINLPVAMRKVFLINEATGYPPLYYLYISAINKQFWSLDLISRVFLSRVATVLLSIGLGIAVFEIGKILFKQILFAYVLAAMTVFQPMRMFAGSGVTSDALMNLIYPLSILLLLKADLRPTWKNLIVLILSLIALLLTKTQGVFLIFISVFFWLKMIIDQKNRVGPKLISAVVLLAIAAVVSIGIINRTAFRNIIPQWLLANMFIPEVEDSGSLSSQPFLIDYIKTSAVDLYRQVLPWYWGVYRWLSLTLPLWVYRVIKIIIMASLIGLIAGFKKIKIVANLKPFAWLIGSSLVYALGIYAWNLLFWRSKGFSFGIQGRYFFPNLPEHMAILLVGLLVLAPLRFRRAIGFATVTLMVLFNWFSLWFLSQSYYGSIINYQTFFLRASQYKPWFFKTPLLEAWLGLGIFTSLWFLLSLMRYTRTQDHENTRTQEH